MKTMTLEALITGVIGAVFGFLIKSVLTTKSLREWAAEQAATNARMEVQLAEVLRRLDRLEV